MGQVPPWRGPKGEIKERYVGVDGRRLSSPKGCDVYPDCFTCPLPRCRYELPSEEVRWWKRELIERGILQAAREGRPIVLDGLPTQPVWRRRRAWRRGRKGRKERRGQEGQEGAVGA
jgi:hypothetical protein